MAEKKELPDSRPWVLARRLGSLSKWVSIRMRKLRMRVAVPMELPRREPKLPCWEKGEEEREEETLRWERVQRLCFPDQPS